MNNKTIGYIGLGKMGLAMVKNLHDKGYDVRAYNRSAPARQEATDYGVKTFDSIEALVKDLPLPRVIWSMLPSGDVTQSVLEELSEILEDGDTVINGANEFFKNTQHHGALLEAKGIHFIDVGVSGGQDGARHGACMMIGGTREIFEQYEELFKDLSAPEAYQFFPGTGAGHYVKMVHNGIEYGMMQAIAEGMDVLRTAPYDINLKDAARIYNTQSIITSRLVQWLKQGYEEHGQDLADISAVAGSGGAAGMNQSEAKWTLDVAQQQHVPAKNIQSAVDARIASQQHPNYQAQVINVLRNQFGGHEASKKDNKA